MNLQCAGMMRLTHAATETQEIPTRLELASSRTSWEEPQETECRDRRRSKRKQLRHGIAGDIDDPTQNHRATDPHVPSPRFRSSKNAEHAKPERSGLKPPERRRLEAPPARHQAEETLTPSLHSAETSPPSRYRAEEPTHTATRHQIIENWHRSTKWKTRSGRFTNPKSRRIELSLTRCPRQGSRDKRPPHADINLLHLIFTRWLPANLRI